MVEGRFGRPNIRVAKGFFSGMVFIILLFPCINLFGLYEVSFSANPPSVERLRLDYPQESPSPRFVFGTFNSQKNKWRGPFHDKVIFPWITIGNYEKNESEYLKWLRYQREQGVKHIAYYYSATTCYPRAALDAVDFFPERAMPTSEVQDSWFLRDPRNQRIPWSGSLERYFLDVGNQGLQEALIARLLQNATRLGVDTLFLDNVQFDSWSPDGSQKADWAAKVLSLLKYAKKKATEKGLRVIANVVAPLDRWNELAIHLDGISYEMAAHPNTLSSAARYREELNVYEQLISEGKSIFLITGTYVGKYEAWDPDGRRVAATALMVMPGNQAQWGGIFVSLPSFESWPVGGWAMWPEQLGKPVGLRAWERDTVTRRFERGSISITCGEEPKFTINTSF